MHRYSTHAKGPAVLASTAKHPATYRKFLTGQYEISVGISPLGTDFGNGEVDRQCFQFDDQRDAYLQAKMSAVNTPDNDCCLTERLHDHVAAAAYRFIRDRLQREHDWLLPQITDSDAAAGLHDVAMQLQEDFAVVSAEDDDDWVSYLNVCLPSSWRPGEVIGRSFFEIHDIVPGMARINATAGRLVNMMVHKGPYVRFNWGLQFDRALDRHPQRNATPPFDPTKPVATVRLERQVLAPLPHVNAVLFIIRPYLTDILDLTIEQRIALHGALLSMSPQTRQYKNLASSWDDLLPWLERQCSL